MTIPEIKLSDAEMVDAVHTYLITRGISVPVELVSKDYSGSAAFRVLLKEPEDEPAVVVETVASQEIRQEVLELRNEINCRIEHGAESGGQLEFVQAKLDAILSETKEQP